MTAIPRRPAFWLRSAISLTLAAAILAIALPVAFGGGVWGGGVDTDRFFSSAPPAVAQPTEHRHLPEPGRNGR